MPTKVYTFKINLTNYERIMVKDLATEKTRVANKINDVCEVYPIRITKTSFNTLTDRATKRAFNI